MFEFTEVFLKPFDWAKRAYDYMLQSIPNTSIEITKDSLTAPIVPSLPTHDVQINTDSDWNINSRDQLSTIGGLYKSIDQAEEYYNSLYTIITSRLSESEKRIQEQDSNLRVLLSSYRNIASTATHIKGGDSISIETDPKYYKVYGPLEALPSEGIFRLKDTGFFSSLRSLGGFAGRIGIDFTLGEMVHNGDIRYIADGSRHTFWTGTLYSPAPLRADQQDINWLPSEYKHGFAFMLTYYMDRPTLATEVYIEPVVTEPMDLISVSWTPMDQESSVINGNFYTQNRWTYVGACAWIASTYGLGAASGSCVTSTSTGWASQTFGVSGNYLYSGSTDLVLTGRRCQIHYSMKGKGDLVAGARIIWLDSSNKIIDYSIKEDYPTGFFTSYRLVDYIPSNAVSGRIELGVFSLSSSASAYFDNVEVLLGERNFQCQEIIDRPKTISLPEIARSGRYSFVLAQRNPRREVLSKEVIDSDIPVINNNIYLDSTLQKATENLSNSFKDAGPGTSIFAYRIGMKELDLRYREHIPRGSIVSLPLFTRKEIREIWLTAEIGQFFNDNTKFYVYPFANNTEVKVEVSPFGIGEVESASTTLLRDGEILRIHTPEEETAGWTNVLDKVYVTSPKSKLETFDGTDREGKIRLNFAPHLRRVLLKQIQDWIKSYSIWSRSFDPNLATLYGLPTTSENTIRNIRMESNPLLWRSTTTSTSGFDLDTVVSRLGYLPLQVTVQTDKWTAVPDTFGRPDISKVRTVLKEELNSTTVVDTIVETHEDFISFDTWLAATTITALNNLLLINGFQSFVAQFRTVMSNYSSNLHDTITLKQVKEDSSNFEYDFRQIISNLLQSVYENLKSQGKLAKNVSSSRTTTSAVEVTDVFSTRFKPVITGPNGAFITLYWYDPENEMYNIIPRSSYEVKDPLLGLIRVHSTSPTSAYTSILADYKYIANSEMEDHFGSIITFASPSSTVTGISAASIGLGSKSFPITRNMTDYEDGKIPSLKRPNFDRLSKDYYPVIEYYVNSDGEIIFARDFFRYGDIPARVTVEYQTLGIQPRVSSEVTRTGSPAATPTIYNLSLRVRESSPLPLRESV